MILNDVILGKNLFVIEFTNIDDCRLSRNYFVQRC